MKTVQDYLDLGLVFVGGDKLRSSTNNKDDKDVCMSGLCIAHQRYCEGFRGGNDVFFYPSEWTPSSFAWRNNDGVKPEYNGAIKVELSSGDVIFNCGKTNEFDWRINDGINPKILRWKPIVISAGIAGCGYSFAINECQKPSFLQQKPKINLIVPDSLKAEVRRVGGEVNVTISQKDKQENDANKKIQEKFLSALRADSAASKNVWNAIREQFCLPVGIDSPELREAFKSLKEHLENKPPFWNKSMPSFNCPCVAVNAEVIKSVSPKEDKPMKPVYTADMHAKNELPPVDSKVKVCIEEAGFYVDEQDVKFEGKAVTVKAAFSNTESEKIVAVENEDGNCYCYIIECIKPIIKTIKVNGFDVTAPMSEAPEHRKMVYLAHAVHVDFNLDFTWQGDDASVSWLSRGLIHSTKSAAIAHAKAMLGIDPNA